jgi:hypothetical protein
MHSMCFDLVKGVLHGHAIVLVVVVCDFREYVFYLHEDELVLGHHRDGLCLDERLIVLLKEARFSLSLSVQFLLQGDILGFKLIIV